MECASQDMERGRTGRLPKRLVLTAISTGYRAVTRIKAVSPREMAKELKHLNDSAYTLLSVRNPVGISFAIIHFYIKFKDNHELAILNLV